MDIPKKQELQLKVLGFNKIEHNFLGLDASLFKRQSTWEYVCKSLNLDSKDYKEGLTISSIGVKKL